MTRASRRFVLSAVGRGWRKRCPHCGRGAIFSGWAHHLDRCSHCGLIYERNPGDTWAFTIIGDRLPVAAMVIIIYFGVFRAHRAIGDLLFVLLAAAFFWTTPNRWGVGIALHYVSRALSADPDDPIPRSDLTRGL